MVAKISVPSSIGRALNYNEQKVQQGKATCLLASGFLKDAQTLKFQDKLSRFQALIALNSRAKTNSVHISLNFAAGEVLPEDRLRQIAALYMEKIGFARQPFLVYEHRDAGHPHLHIVTTNIRRDGSRISLHNLGKDASEKARKELEVQFGLARAGEKKKSKEPSEEQPFPTQKAVYGKLPTKRAITNILDAVLPHYHYASLPELNAILKGYNVVADRGTEDSVIYRTGGLVYRILDEGGNKVGVPVKASAIYTKPTLSFLQQRFKENAPQKEAYKKQILSAIDWVMMKPPQSVAALQKALQKEKIEVAVRQNKEGFVYGLTYIDHCSKCVFNGSDLGKPYSAKGVLERCGIAQPPPPEKTLQTMPVQTKATRRSQTTKTAWNKEAALALLDKLLAAEGQEMAVPFQLSKQKKKRRKI